VRFLRHLAAAVLVVAVVVALAVGWEHLFASSPSGAAGFVTKSVPLHAEIARSNPRAIRFRATPGAGFDLAEAGNLRHTVIIVAVILGGVVAVDLVRRRQHRDRRRAALRPPAAAEPDQDGYRGSPGG
jgi:hypothetical protein